MTTPTEMREQLAIRLRKLVLEEAERRRAISGQPINEATIDVSRDVLAASAAMLGKRFAVALKQDNNQASRRALKLTNQVLQATEVALNEMRDEIAGDVSP